MFTTPCFISKNTPELRSKLEELGYKPMDGICPSNWIIQTGEIGLYFKISSPQCAFGIDCGENEILFLALVALTDDSDYMQWFTDGEEYILCDRQDWIDMYSTLCCGGHYENGAKLDKFHKATPEELINHFKNESN